MTALRRSIKTFWELDEPNCCALCGYISSLERHHKIYRSRQGSDDPDNLILLCKVCHGAVHGLKVHHNDHSCASCEIRKREGCHFGESVLGLEVVTPPPWESRL